MQPCSTEMLCFYENRIYCWGCRLLRCDSVSHVSVWSAAMPLFPFAGRPGITQGKAGRQTQGGEAAKNLTYYREVRLLLFAVTFRLSGLCALFLFLFFWLPFHWKIYFLQPPFFLRHKYELYFFFPHIWAILSLSHFVVSVFVSLSLSLSLSQTSCAVPPSPKAASLTSQRNASQEVVLSALYVCVCVCVCVWTLKRIGDLVLS